ncbi:MAG: hypothetical protein GC193_03320 [Cryomorphaceae bacterium]|nr:hypothetical protein [Cryomorphaceae bacterium]
MRTKWIYIIVALLIAGITVVLYFSLKNDDVLIRKDFKRNLFSSSDFNASLNCYKDLIGLSTDGAFFDFYQYEIDGLQESSLKGNFPKFENVFESNNLTNTKLSYWKQTPIPKEKGLYHFDIAYSSNLSKSDCPREFQRKDPLSQAGNYYSYISAYPIGVCLLIYCPSEKALYIISKK